MEIMKATTGDMSQKTGRSLPCGAYILVGGGGVSGKPAEMKGPDSNRGWCLLCGSSVLAFSVLHASSLQESFNHMIQIRKLGSERLVTYPTKSILMSGPKSKSVVFLASKLTSLWLQDG